MGLFLSCSTDFLASHIHFQIFGQTATERLGFSLNLMIIVIVIFGAAILMDTLWIYMRAFSLFFLSNGQTTHT